MSAAQRSLVHQVTRFLLGACLGLAVDLLGFALMVHLGAAPGVANVVSAASSVLVVYLFVTKYAFAGRRTRTSFVLFVTWYVVSIGIFSVLIELLHEATGWAPFVCKLVSLAPSFAANFLASKLLFGGDRPGRPVGADDLGVPPARDVPS